MSIVLNDLFDYKNRMIYQDNECFKFSLDSILLAEYVKLKKGNNILDLCTGNASIPLILTTKSDINVTGFGIQKEIYDLAIKSIEYNKLNNIKIINANILDIDKYLKGKKFDIITCNPPYFKYEDDNFINEKESLAIARHEIYVKLEDIFSISSRYLNDGGILYLVHRVSRLDEIIIYANKYNINVKEINFIQTKKDNLPSIVLIKCIKSAKNGIKLNKTICIDGLSSYQNIFEEEK